MIRTSHQLCASALKKNGRLLFGANEIPPEMPKLKGGYKLVALLGGKTWQYGHFIHNGAFYNELFFCAHKFNFTIDGLISIHPAVLETIPKSDLIRHGD